MVFKSKIKEELLQELKTSSFGIDLNSQMI